MKYSLRRSVLAAVLVIAMCGISSAADTLTFAGKLTLTSDGKEFAVDGQKSIPLPETLKTSTQDDTGYVMPQVFERDGLFQKEAAITAKASEPFTVSGKRVLGVYAIRKDSKNRDSLESIGGEKSPFTIPNEPGDFYILIANTEKEEKESDEIDAAIFLYVKLTVK